MRGFKDPSYSLTRVWRRATVDENENGAKIPAGAAEDGSSPDCVLAPRDRRDKKERPRSFANVFGKLVGLRTTGNDQARRAGLQVGDRPSPRKRGRSREQLPRDFPLSEGPRRTTASPAAVYLLRRRNLHLPGGVDLSQVVGNEDALGYRVVPTSRWDQGASNMDCPAQWAIHIITGWIGVSTRLRLAGSAGHQHLEKVMVGPSGEPRFESRNAVCERRQRSEVAADGPQLSGMRVRRTEK
jgi:hypothetical protein